MRFRLESDIGGLLWWLLIRFCKTKLEDEQTKDKWSRNIFFLCMMGFLMLFIAVKFY
jgi:hypothetical protein